MVLTYNSQERQFELPIESNSATLLIPFPFSDKDLNGNAFELKAEDAFTLQEWTKSVAENDIHEVKIRSRVTGESDFRIGWLFPYVALISTEHDFVENPHFLFYAFHAYAELLKDNEVVTRLQNGERWENIINERISQDKNLLVVENSNLHQDTQFKELELSMFMYGYSHGRVFESSIFLHCQENANHTIYLTRCKQILNTERDSYISNYVEEFLNSFIGERNPFIAFFFIYQLFEVLLDDVLISKLKKLIDKVDKGTASVRQIDKQLQDNTEAKRLEKIVKESNIKITNYKDLRKICNEYIPEREEQYGIPDCIYQVRNRVVHRFRLVASDEEAMKKVNDELLMFSLDLLNRYVKS